VDFDEVADELFGLAPGEFVAARDRRAKQARADGDKDLAARIAELRKPTAVAWLANQLARRQPDELADFLDLGESLREATAALSGPALRDLSRQRQQLVAAMVRQARRLGGNGGPRVTEDVARGLEETLNAALADPAAAGLLAAGRLTGGLRHTGFGAAPATGPAGRAAPKPGKAAGRTPDAAQQRRAAERDRLERELGLAWAEARRTAEARDEAAAAVASADAAYDEAACRTAALEQQLAEARDAQAAAGQTRDAARAAGERADEAAQRARRAVTDLQAQLDRS
jgi:hypothetical protein